MGPAMAWLVRLAAALGPLRLAAGSSGSARSLLRDPFAVSAVADAEADPAAPLQPVTISVGEAQVHFITDGAVTAKATWMFPSLVGNDEALAAFPDGNVSLAYGCVLVQAGGQNVLLDASLGTGHDSAFSGPWTTVRPLEDLRNGLAALGVAAGSIGHVVHSHMHRDHTGWAIEGGEPLFPSAKHYFQSAEVAYWGSSQGNKDRVRWDDNIQPLLNRSMVEEVDGDSEDIAPGVRIFAWPGHTPGHQIVQIKSGQETAYYIGDAMHTEQQLAQPELGPFFDWAPTTAAAQRRALLQRMVEERAKLLSPHLPFPGWGWVVSDCHGGFTYTKTPAPAPCPAATPPPPVFQWVVGVIGTFIFFIALYSCQMKARNNVGAVELSS